MSRKPQRCLTCGGISQKPQKSIGTQCRLWLENACTMNDTTETLVDDLQNAVKYLKNGSVSVFFYSVDTENVWTIQGSKKNLTIKLHYQNVSGCNEDGSAKNQTKEIEHDKDQSEMVDAFNVAILAGETNKQNLLNMFNKRKKERGVLVSDVDDLINRNAFCEFKYRTEASANGETVLPDTIDDKTNRFEETPFAISGADKRSRTRRCKGGSALKKRRTITLEEKLDIVKRYEGGQTLTSISRALGYATSTINSIVKDKERIREHVKCSASLNSTVITKQRSGILYEMENLLSAWIQDQKQQHVTLNRVTIQEKAKRLYEELKAKKGETVGSFVASYGWYNRFKNRANLKSLKYDADGAIAAKKFCTVLAETIDEGGYLPEQVFNVDETGLFWKWLPERICNSKNEKSAPASKAADDHLTLLLGGNAAGDCKLKPFLVYHGEKPHAATGIFPVLWKCTPKGWGSISLFKEWFWDHLIVQLKEYCHARGLPYKILLVLDNAFGYPSHLGDFRSNIAVVYMPSNVTSLLQPMDQGVIAIFKAYYLRRTFTQAIESATKDFWNSYDITDAIKNIAAAWDEVLEASMNGVWRKLCPRFVKTVQGFEQSGIDEAKSEVVELARQLQLGVDVCDSHDDVTNDNSVESEMRNVNDFNNEEEVTNEDSMESETPNVTEKNDEDDEPNDSSLESCRPF